MTYLLDVCALIALGDHWHSQNRRMERWIVDVQKDARKSVCFATCAITELGFVRITSAGTDHDVEAAKRLLRLAKTGRPFIFLGDELGAEQLPAWVTKSKQTTDGDLLELARTHQAQLATLDTGIPGALLIPEPSDLGWRVEEPTAHYGKAA